MSSLQRITFSGLLISLSLILSRIGVSFAFGGSITLFSLVPMIIISLKYGYKWGSISGIILGILHLMTTNVKFQGLTLYSVVISIILDYIIPDMIIGLSSYFILKFKGKKYDLLIGIIIAFVLKLIIHILSGVIVWYDILEEKPMMSPVIYSTIYNSSYVIPELIINLLGISIIKKTLPNLIKPEL